MPYMRKKGGYTQAKITKSNREKFLSVDQVQALLQAVLDSDEPAKRRDHAAIYLGYHFGLRVGEALMLERDNFRKLAEGVVYIRTLKNIERIPFFCCNPDCGRRCRVAATRSGTQFKCSRCGTVGKVPVPKKPIDKLPPEKEPPFCEEEVCEYVQDYLDNVMRKDQRWLFEAYPGWHMSATTMRAIFNTYAAKAGLSKVYSWHALRHGRGVMIWERFHDDVMVRDMLRQKSISSAEMYMHMSPQRVAEAREKMRTGSIAANPFHRPEGAA